MYCAILLPVCLALLSFQGAGALRSLTLAAPSCTSGSPYEEYTYDASKSFHAIMSLKEGVKSVEECAQLCIAQKDEGCTCALYTAANELCQWRQTACSTSEMFKNAKPVSAKSGLIAMCPQAQPKPQPVPQPQHERLPRWSTCGGKTYRGSHCCSHGDVCRVKNEWYAQCIPKEALRPLWENTILRSGDC